MAHLSPEAITWLRTHHGVTTRALLRDHDVGRRTIERLVASGLLVAVSPFKSVLRVATAPETFEQRCAAVCLAHPRGFITGVTGGRLEGLRRMPRQGLLVHLAIPHGMHVDQLPEVRFRQTTKIEAVDVRTRGDGIVLASPPRLAFDLAADLGRQDHLSVLEQMLHEGRCTFATLVSTARRLARPGRRGSARFVRNLEAHGGRPPSESHPELELAEALRARGVPIVVQSTWLELPNGRRIRLDISVPALRWGIEVDVHPEHLGLFGGTSDKQRDRQCHLIGWQVERVTELDLLDLPNLVDELVMLYQARRAALAA